MLPTNASIWLTMNGLLMIGIDTNVILRFMTRDDEGQHNLASKIFQSASFSMPLCVNLVTLTETVWVLESRMKLAPEKARAIISTFLEAQEVLLLPLTKLPDPMAMLRSRHRGWTDVVVAAVNRENGCDFTYTFDERAAKSVPGMELLA